MSSVTCVRHGASSRGAGPRDVTSRVAGGHFFMVRTVRLESDASTWDLLRRSDRLETLPQPSDRRSMGAAQEARPGGPPVSTPPRVTTCPRTMVAS